MQKISKLWQLTYALGCLLVFVPFAYFGRPDQGAVAAFSVAAIVLAVKIRWDLISKLWFIGLISTITLAHIVAIFSIDWRLALHPTILYAPLVVVDFAAIVFLIYIVDHFFRGDR